MGEEDSLSCFQINALNDVGIVKMMKDNSIETFVVLLTAGLWGKGNPDIISHQKVRLHGQANR